MEMLYAAVQSTNWLMKSKTLQGALQIVWCPSLPNFLDICTRRKEYKAVQSPYIRLYTLFMSKMESSNLNFFLY